jgi:hypothetical protein
MPFLDRATAFRVRLAMLRGHEVTPGDVRFWSAVCSYVAQEGERRDLAAEIFRLGLEHAADDATRAEIAFAADVAFDLDDPADRKRFAEVLKPYRGPAKHPRTAEVGRFHDVLIALRTGQPADPAALVREARHPFVKLIAPTLALRHALQRKDVQGLENLLALLGTEKMTSRFTLEHVLPALALCKRKEEAALVREAARRELYRAILESWVDLDSAHTVFDLARELDGRPAYPRAWLADCLRRTKAEHLNLTHRLAHDMLAKDWAALARDGAEAVKRFPRHYDLYWYRGYGLYRLGRKAEARTALAIFTTYCKDSPEYPRALKLLEELGK